MAEWIFMSEDKKEAEGMRYDLCGDQRSSRAWSKSSEDLNGSILWIREA